MKDLYLEKNMNPQVAILYATVADTFKRLQKLVEGTDEKELSFKELKNNENSIGQLLQHLAVVDLHWVYRLKGEPVPLALDNIYGPMLNEVGELPSLRKHTLQQLMQDYEAVQHMFYEECLKLTENDLTREVFYPTLMG
ncbi:DinB family protein, partial [Bacillus paranthracis]|uniref:DinB family protein n=1 Tax=Bacillus paranthracis TaxID=2026186 RepID=UPI003D1D5E8B